MTENSTSLPGDVPENDEAMADVQSTDAATGPEPVAEGDAEQPKKRRLGWKILAVVVVVAVLVAVALPIFSTLQPRYYKRYASLHGRMVNWEVSTHAKVPCSGCHMNPGVGGFLAFAAQGDSCVLLAAHLRPQAEQRLRLAEQAGVPEVSHDLPPGLAER